MVNALISKASLTILAVFLLGSASLVWAQSAEDYFEQGVVAARQGDHKSALELFQKAREAGLDQPSLDYDQAVSFYRLGYFAQSHELFLKLTDNKEFSQLAYFNLGLVANKQNDAASAVGWFQKAYTNNANEKVTALAATALKRLGKIPTKPEKVTSSLRSSWKSYASAMLSSDSNVNLATDEISQPSSSDTSIELYASTNRWLSGDIRGGNRIELSGILQNYSTETQYNFAQLHAGLSHMAQLSDWDLQVNGSVDELNVDGSHYERIYSATADGSKDLTTDRRLHLRYRFSNITAMNSRYDYLAGTRHQFRAGVQQRYEKKRLRAYYQYEINNRDDYVSPTTSAFTSYSPTRHTLDLDGTFPIAPDWEAGLGGRYRISNYSHANDLPAPVGGSKTREDIQTSIFARLAYAMAKNRGLELKYSQTTNDSNITSYDYNGNVIQLGMNWLF